MSRMTSSPLLGTGLGGVEMNELQGDADASRSRRFPNLAEPAPSQPAHQHIAGNRLHASRQFERHAVLRVKQGSPVPSRRSGNGGSSASEGEFRCRASFREFRCQEFRCQSIFSRNSGVKEFGVRESFRRKGIPVSEHLFAEAIMMNRHRIVSREAIMMNRHRIGSREAIMMNRHRIVSREAIMMNRHRIVSREAIMMNRHRIVSIKSVRSYWSRTT